MEWTNSYQQKIITSAEIIVDVTTGFTIIAPPGPYQTGQDYTFSVQTGTPETLPDDIYYTWDFGDGPVLTIPFNNEVVYEFEKAGPYVIHVGVFETGDPVDIPIGSAITTVEVEASGNYLTELHKMKKFNLSFRVESDWINPLPGQISTFPWEHESWAELNWDGVYFSMQ